MRKNFLLISIALCSVLSFAQAPPISWQKSLGGSGGDYAKDIKQTSDGGYIVVGDVESNDGDVTGNHGGFSDAWVVKLNSSGAIQWQKAMGGSFEEEFRSVQQTTDGGYILLGETASPDGDVSGYKGGSADFWLVKLDNTGTMQWQKCIGGTSEDIGYGVQQTSDGGYILIGVAASSDGDATGNRGNPGTKDIWVVKTNSTGTIQWQKNFGTTGNDQGNFISQTADGGYILAGGANRIDGDLSCSLHGGNDSWIIKLDNAGSIQWQQCLGSSGSEMASCIKENTDGSFIMLSSTNSTGGDVSGWHDPGGSFPTDYWVVKLSGTGTILWQKCLGGTSADNPSYSIQQTNDGGYVVAGWTSSTNGDVTGMHGGEDFWVVKLDAAGTIQWQKCYGGSGVDDCLALQQTTDGGYIMAGISQSTDGDVTGGHGSWDVWVVKLGGTVLPVNLVSFTGTKNNKSVLLKWRTASEQNSDHFNIERSNDGRQFTTIGTVMAAGSSSSIREYSFNDNSLPDLINYYRLKQTDIDGKFAYSAVIRIRNNETEILFTVSPNPAGHVITVTSSGKNEIVEISIYDNLGKLVRRQSMRSQINIQLEVSQLKPGIYFISMQDGTTIQKGKFIKQ